MAKRRYRVLKLALGARKSCTCNVSADFLDEFEEGALFGGDILAEEGVAMWCIEASVALSREQACYAA